MAYENIKYEKRDGIAFITFNRPDKLNALSPELMQQFGAVLDELNRDDEVRCVVLTGAGDAFTAALADDVTMGVLFSRKSALDMAVIKRMCHEIGQPGRGVIGVSTVLSPNAVILLGGMAWINSSGITSLSRNPLAPARSAPKT